jgi:hypothetical protein
MIDGRQPRIIHARHPVLSILILRRRLFRSGLHSKGSAGAGQADMVADRRRQPGCLDPDRLLLLVRSALAQRHESIVKRFAFSRQDKNLSCTTGCYTTGSQKEHSDMEGLATAAGQSSMTIWEPGKQPLPAKSRGKMGRPPRLLQRSTDHAAFFSGFFDGGPLPRLHSAIACSLRSRARPSGRWQVHFIWRSTFQTWLG